MAGRKAGSASRSEFIRTQLRGKSDVKLADINDAWKKAGHSGAITPTLFYQVKSKMGLSKRRGGRRRGRPPGSGSAPRAAKPTNGYAQIESTLDTLIAEARSMGDSRLAEGLRAARRLASVKLV